jgi:hypothetical protein
MDRARLLKEIYGLMFAVMTDNRDARFKKQINLLWKEYQKRGGNVALGPGNANANVIDITPVENGPELATNNTDNNVTVIANAVSVPEKEE